MPLPPTRYIDAGPGVPLANPQAAMAQGEAMARMGNTIAQIGERGFRIAEQVRKVEETGKMSAFFSNLDEEAAQFSTDLMTRSDTGAWPTEWKEKTGEMRERMKQLGISPEGMARAEIEFGDWSTQRSIHFETQAATKALQMGRAQVSNSLNYYASRGDLESYKREADRAREGGILDPVEHEQAMREGETLVAQQQTDEDIQTDPRGYLEHAKSSELLPGETVDMRERGKRDAELVIKQQAAAAASSVQDDVFTGKIKTAEQLEADPRFKDLMEDGEARMASGIKREFDALQDEKVKALRSTDGYQHRAIGLISAKMDSLKPDDVESRVEVERLISQLNPGATKSQLTASLRKKIAGEPEDDDALALNLQLATDAFKGGFFDRVKPVDVSISGAIDAGFLKDRSKLVALGYSESKVGSSKSKVDEIIGAKSDAARKDLFQAGWNTRGKAAADVDPTVWATAEAIRDGLSSVKIEDKKAQMDAIAEYGRIINHVRKWTKANPQADVNAIRNEMMRVAAPGEEDAYLNSAFGGSGFDPDLLDGGVLPPKPE